MSGESPGASPRTALHSLRRFLQRPAIQERCELCSAPLTADHPHLVELSNRRLVCACDPCAILFDAQNAGKYRRAPRDIRFLADFRLADETWLSLDLPINLAFFLYSTSAQRILALYPSPGGATEALPPPDAWQMLVEDNPILQTMQPDVEALLVNRVRSPHDHYLVGIDKCYELVGLIRSHWRGLSGGTAVWKEIERFFAGLKGRAQRVGGTAHA